MRKLISANIFRLWRSKAFWFVALAMFVWGATVYTFFHINAMNMGIEGAQHNVYFFNGILCLGAAIAVFCSFFIGSECGDGTLRNKLTVGHTRVGIYLSNFIISGMAGILFMIAFWIGAMLVGLTTEGMVILTGVQHPIPGILCSFMVAIVYASIYCFVAMTDSNKTRSAVIGLALAVFLFAGGFATQDGLDQPEYTYRMVLSENGEYELEGNIPNSKYLTGTKRVVYECIDAVLPSCHALRPILTEAEYSATMPVCAAGVTVVMTLGGICIFRKKDLK